MAVYSPECLLVKGNFWKAEVLLLGYLSERVAEHVRWQESQQVEALKPKRLGLNASSALGRPPNLPEAQFLGLQARDHTAFAFSSCEAYVKLAIINTEHRPGTW